MSCWQNRGEPALQLNRSIGHCGPTRDGASLTGELRSAGSQRDGRFRVDSCRASIGTEFDSNKEGEPDSVRLPLFTELEVRELGRELEAAAPLLLRVRGGLSLGGAGLTDQLREFRRG